MLSTLLAKSPKHNKSYKQTKQIHTDTAKNTMVVNRKLTITTDPDINLAQNLSVPQFPAQ